MSRKSKRKAVPHLEDRSELLASLPLKGELDPDLLDLALTHRSYSFEHDECPQNERLEYLGDAVLGLAVADHLYRAFPDAPQGSLSRRRSTVVSTRALSHIARLHNLGAYLKLGKGEALTGGRDRDSVLEDAVEAIIGAVHLSLGAEAARVFVLDLLSPILDDDTFMLGAFDYKSRLQEIGALLDAVPTYTYDTWTEGDAEHFRAHVSVGDSLAGTGEGTSKKVAEMEAARRAVLAYYSARGETFTMFED